MPNHQEVTTIHMSTLKLVWTCIHIWNLILTNGIQRKDIVIWPYLIRVHVCCTEIPALGGGKEMSIVQLLICSIQYWCEYSSFSPFSPTRSSGYCTVWGGGGVHWYQTSPDIWGTGRPGDGLTAGEFPTHVLLLSNRYMCVCVCVIVCVCYCVCVLLCVSVWGEEVWLKENLILHASLRKTKYDMYYSSCNGCCYSSCHGNEFPVQIPTCQHVPH